MTNTGTLSRLYTGEGGLDFVGRRRLWYSITGVLLLVCLLAIIFRGFTLGIDFQGGTKMNMPAGDTETSQVEEVFTQATGVTPQLVQVVGSGDSRILEINSERLTDDQINKARSALFERFQPKDATGVANPDAVGDSTVSESWGSTITYRMLLHSDLPLHCLPFRTRYGHCCSCGSGCRRRGHRRYLRSDRV